jgi:spore maturation protein CgeB
VPVESLGRAILERKGWTGPSAAKPRGELNIHVISSVTDWETVLPKSLEPFGSVSTFMWESGRFIRGREKWISSRHERNRAMLVSFRDGQAARPVNIVVGYMTDYDTMSETVLEIKRTGAIVVNMCFDDKLYFSGKYKGCMLGVRGLAPAVDLNLTNSPGSMVKYVACGGLAMFWPGAGHPEVHKPHDLPFEFDVSFVGRKYGWRPDFIRGLRKRGIDVACFGPGWNSGVLSGEEMVKLYSRSRINLGFAGVGHSRKLMCLKGRDFEVPMSGGLYLTQNNPELSLVYDVGREIVTYEGIQDCAGKIEWLLANPGEAAGIRISGRKRALNDHTWEKRFEDLFRIIGLLE